MRKYQQVTIDEREIMYGMLQQGKSFRVIGKKLGRSHTSIAREVKRNITYGNAYFPNTYLPCKAQQLAEKRSVNQRTKAPLKNPEIFLYVRNHLRMGWSPETIAGRIRIDHPELSICHETIYQYIYNKKKTTQKMHLQECVTLRRKKRMKQNGRRVQRHSKIPEAVSIDERPSEVALRRAVGHWETDNIIGRQTDKTALSVTVASVCRVTLVNKLFNRTAVLKTTMVAESIHLLAEIYTRTIPADNGSENTNHKELPALTTMQVYCCHPYHSWERGTVENTNGRIRRFIPKGISIDKISEKYIAAMEYKLNTTPRKCLQYLTPYEMLAKLQTTTT